MSVRLVDFGYDVITVKKMTTARRSPEGTTTTNLSWCLITLPRTAKSQEIFKVARLCHISVKVESL
jgi:hypothetical protein